VSGSQHILIGPRRHRARVSSAGACACPTAVGGHVQLGGAALRLAAGARQVHGAIGHGFTSQIRAAYSETVRSLENLPDAATFRSAFRAQAIGSA
jgi:hypothetical protein